MCQHDALVCRVWELSDLDADGYLTPEELAVAMYLMNKARNEGALPTSLPREAVPPSFRR